MRLAAQNVLCALRRCALSAHRPDLFLSAPRMIPRVRRSPDLAAKPGLTRNDYSNLQSGEIKGQGALALKPQPGSIEGE